MYMYTYVHVYIYIYIYIYIHIHTHTHTTRTFRRAAYRSVLSVYSAEEEPGETAAIMAVRARPMNESRRTCQIYRGFTAIPV